MDRSVVLRFIRAASFLPTLGIVAIITLVACLMAFQAAGFMVTGVLLVLGVTLAIAIVRWGASEQTKLSEAS